MKCFIDNFKELGIDELLNINGGYAIRVRPSYSSSIGGGYGSGGLGHSSGESPKRAYLDPSGPDYDEPPEVKLEFGCIKYKQTLFSEKYKDEFGNNACALTSMINGFSEIYSKKKGRPLDKGMVYNMIDAAIDAGGVNSTNANIDDWQKAIDAMLGATGMSGKMQYDYAESGASDVVIYALDRKGDSDPLTIMEKQKVNPQYKNIADHFVVSLGGGKFFDPWDGEIKSIMEPIKVNGQDYVLFWDRPIRGFNYIEG